MLIDRRNTWNTISEWLDWWLSQAKLDPVSQEILDEYYSSYRQSFGPYLQNHYSNQTEEICRLIQSMENPKVLEVGCGCGTESLWFSLLGADVLGIDLQESRLNVARCRREYLLKATGIDLQANFVFSSFFDLEDKPPAFDIIWMEQAFHHVEPRHKLPSRAWDLLKPGGYLVISEANALNPLLQLQLIKKRGFRTIDEYTDLSGKVHVYGNERVTTPGGIRELFRGKGFEWVSSRFFRALPNIRGVEKIAWLEELIPHWIAPAFTHYNVVLRRQ